MADAAFLTIGKVVKKLQDRYPDLTVTKVRYLEDQGLLNPSRTTSGFRLYSQRDLVRLETILHLQKTRFLPLAVIKEELDHPQQSQSAQAVSAQDQLNDLKAKRQQLISDEARSKLHAIDRIPDLCKTSVSFVRQLSEASVIRLVRSPQGRDLVDGSDLDLIALCAELRHFGFEAKNLRQYVHAANRESTMFEQALAMYAAQHKHDEGSSDASEINLVAICDQMLELTNTLRAELIRRHIRQTRTTPQHKGE